MERIVRFNHTTLEFSVACYERTNNSTVSSALVGSVVVDSQSMILVGLLFFSPSPYSG